MYVSITSLKLKPIRLLPKFVRQSNFIERQTSASQGILKVKLSNQGFQYFDARVLELKESEIDNRKKGRTPS